LILPIVSPLLLAAMPPSSPVDVRAVLVELTIDANRVVRACETLESSGSRVIDDAACLFATQEKIDVPADLLPAPGTSTTIKWKRRAAMVQFADGASRFVVPPETMMRRAFLRRHPEGQRGAILVEALDGKRGARTCAFFVPRTVSRFDSATCSRVVSVDPATDSTIGERRPALLWRKATVASGDL